MSSNKIAPSSSTSHGTPSASVSKASKSKPKPAVDADATEYINVQTIYGEHTKLSPYFVRLPCSAKITDDIVDQTIAQQTLYELSGAGVTCEKVGVVHEAASSSSRV